ncbi:MAG: GNAT family N-acetyltransferase [bacterium]|nr:GNAT family N-acetyltransferase [bacterium]
MKKLDNTHLQQAMAYLSGEPEFNLFFTGDIENCGMASDIVRTYTADSWTDGDFPYFILDYLGNFLVYSKDADYDVKSVAEFLSSQTMENLSGKQEIVEKLCPYFPDRTVQRTYMSRLNQVNPDFPFPDIPVKTEQTKNTVSDTFCIRKLTEADAESVYSLYILIDEFHMYHGLSREEAIKKQRRNLKNDIYFGLFERGVLVSIAAISAATKTSAMIVGVATRPEYRKKGYASAVMGTLCRESLAEGRQFLCLFYDNPAAGKIYNRIGFKELGIWTMLRSPSE